MADQGVQSDENLRDLYDNCYPTIINTIHNVYKKEIEVRFNLVSYNLIFTSVKVSAESGCRHFRSKMCIKLSRSRGSIAQAWLMIMRIMYSQIDCVTKFIVLLSQYFCF